LKNVNTNIISWVATKSEIYHYGSEDEINEAEKNMTIFVTATLSSYYFRNCIPKEQIYKKPFRKFLINSTNLPKSIMDVKKYNLYV
jgi:hypothetical protein